MERPETIRPALEPRARRSLALWSRRIAVLGMTAVVLLAVAGVFGQQPRESVTRAEAATLVVSAPDRLRGGLLYQGRLLLEARRPIRSPTLRLASGGRAHEHQHDRSRPGQYELD